MIRLLCSSLVTQNWLKGEKSKEKRLNISVFILLFSLNYLFFLFLYIFSLFLQVHNRNRLHEKKSLQSDGAEGPRPTPCLRVAMKM